MSSLHELHRDLPDSDKYRRIAIDVFHFQLASQANMYAGMAWTMVRLLKEHARHLKHVQDEFRRLHADTGVSSGRVSF